MTVVTRSSLAFAENPNVSEETIRALAGHVSKKMLERYSHIRISAKQVAIAGLEQAFSTISEENPIKAGHKIGHNRGRPTRRKFVSS